MKKKTFGMIGFLLAAISLASCGEGTAVDRKTETEPISDVITAQSENAADTEETIPQLEVKDLNGRVMNVFIRSEWNYEFVVEEETGDIVSDAIFKRNSKISELYNCTFNFIEQPGNWANHDKFGKTIHNSVLARDGAHDFIVGYEACIPFYVANGDLLNLLELPYLDLRAEWWTQQGVDALTINGKCFMAGGDIATSLIEGLYCMVFNKQLAEENDVENLYELVRDHKWTHEAMERVTKDLGRDLDGNGVMDQNDQYGYMTRDGFVRNYQIAYNTPTVTWDDNGSLEIIWYNEHTVSVVEKMVTFANGKDSLILNKVPIDEYQAVFANNQVFIMAERISASSKLRSMKEDFGIIPFPMFDEAQEDYLTTTEDVASMICVPITSPNPDDTALIIEALCRESHLSVTPVLFEKALSGKYTRDEESAEMLTLIRNSLTFDCGAVNSQITGLAPQIYCNMVNGKNTDFASWYATNEKGLISSLDKFLAAYLD